MEFSKRILDIGYSPIRKLAAYGESAKNKGIKIYHLNIGQPDIETPKEFINGINKYEETVLKYAQSQGISPLINSFIEYYKQWGINFNEDEMLITNGGSEAISFALTAICDVDDQVIIPEPFYTNYAGFAGSVGVKVIPFLTKAEEGFHLPPRESIEAKITSRTKAIMLSNPGNPTGVIYTESEIRMVADICKKFNLYFISDEVYREFVYDGLAYTSPLHMEDIIDKVILIDSISKRYSACGARIGLVASKNKMLINQILKLCQTRLCVPTLEQLGATNLINTPKEYFEAVKREYEGRRDVVYEKLSKIPGVICEKPNGAFYIIVKLPVKSGDDFAKWLLTDYNYENKTVMVAPANGFYATKGLGEDEIRISYCLNSEDLSDAMDILEKALDEYIKIHK